MFDADCTIDCIIIPKTSAISMTKFFIAFVLFVCINTMQSFAQLPPIQLDRPDQTECPFITPKGYIQLESGFNFENVTATAKRYIYPSILWKYGMNETFEFRLITEMVTEKEGNQSVTGLMPITIGFKSKICDEKGLLPSAAFIGHIATSNVGSKDFQTSFIAPSFRFNMQHTLSGKMTLAYNLGAEWNGENAEQTYLYTLTTGYSFTDKLGAYIELFGFLPSQNAPEHAFDGGITYLVNNDFMLDLSGGFGISNNALRNYVALGISYRFRVRKT